MTHPEGDDLKSGSPLALPIIAGVAAPILVGLLLAPIDGELRSRLALTALGLLLMALGTFRPPGFWTLPRSVGFRRLVGDLPFVLFHQVGGAGIIAAAWLLPIH